MKRLKLNLDQLGQELETLELKYLSGIKGGSGEYGGYDSMGDLWNAIQNGYIPPEGTYTPGGYGGYGDWGDFGGYGGYNNPIDLPEMEVIGYGGYNNGYWNPWGSSGYDNGWANYGGYYFYGYDNYGGYYGGYYGSSGGGNGSGGSSSGTEGQGEGDPWKRDSNNNVVIITTNNFSDKSYIGYNDSRFDNVSLKMQEVTIIGAHGEEIKAYRVVSYKDSNGVEHFDIPDRYKSNCHGFAMGIDLWIDDPYNPNAQNIDEVHEDKEYQDMMNTSYASNSTNATVISFYAGNELMHSIVRDPSTGKIWSKTDIEGVKEYDSLEDFYDGNYGKNRTIYENLTQKYYKP